MYNNIKPVNPFLLFDVAIRVVGGEIEDTATDPHEGITEADLSSIQGAHVLLDEDDARIG